jgi:hypothetical protein
MPTSPLPGSPRGQFCPDGVRYNGRTQGWSLDANGRRMSIHRIDSGVQLAMFAQKGELLSDPDIGNELLNAKELGTDRQHAEVEGIIRRANPIARYLAAGDITFTRVIDELRTSTGALMVAFYYHNNRTGEDGIARNYTPNDDR